VAGGAVIARVRIAPVEQWCKSNGDSNDIENSRPEMCPNIVGVEVEIHTAPVVKSCFCDGRLWILTASSTAKLEQLLGKDWDGTQAQICEHMLEMD
jgi:hypothetical protein